MALSFATASLGFAGNLAAAPRAELRMETKADLEVLAKKLNPVVGFWDPMGLVEPREGNSFMGQFGDEGTIGFLRHAEIKHGRIAMAAFVGFIVGANKICFPWALTSSGTMFSDIAAAGSPPAQWDALPTASKWQIFIVIGLLEAWGEGFGGGTYEHYMSGGKPGVYPSFAPIRDQIGHPNLDLFDPFGFSKKATPEQKERGLLIEINNGRAAMIGIMGFVAAAAVEGSVPSLDGVVPHYDGEVMAPWGPGDTSVPYVAEMLKFPHLDNYKYFGGPKYW